MRTLHPFPARMAPEVVYSHLPSEGEGRSVLDPMSGSGTTLAAARLRGFTAVGVDSDPLALIIARANVTDLHTKAFTVAAETAHKDAIKRARLIKANHAYPRTADFETREFIDFWFDDRARIELTALSRSMENLPSPMREFVRCAFSRMIITKSRGVSLGEDVSHSRPHRTRKHPPIYPLAHFPACVRAVSRASNFPPNSGLPKARIDRGDCRNLPYANSAFDYIVTSPPYLNAIDYLRGHKLSLVWFGYTISQLRQLRSTNIGTEVGQRNTALDHVIDHMIVSSRQPQSRLLNRLRTYVADISTTLSECRRVLRDGGRAVFVIGDCTIADVDVRNSVAINKLAVQHGFRLTRKTRRPLLEGRRYLAPPSGKSGARLGKRMWEEIVLEYDTV